MDYFKNLKEKGQEEFNQEQGLIDPIVIDTPIVYQNQTPSLIPFQESYIQLLQDKTAEADHYRAVVVDLCNDLYSDKKTDILPEKIEADTLYDTLFYYSGKVINGIKKELARKPICKGLPLDCITISYDDKFNKNDEIVVRWSNEKETIFALDSLESKKSLDLIVTTGAAEILSRDHPRDIIRRIFAYIHSTAQVKKTSFHVEYNAGWFLGNSGKFYFKYIPEDMKISEIYRRSGIAKNRLFADKKRAASANISDVIRRLNIFKSTTTGFLLLMFLIYSVTQTLYKEAGISMNKALMITGNASSIDRALSAFLQVYNTNKSCLIPLKDTKVLKEKLFNSKDEAVLFSEPPEYDDKQAVKKQLLEIVKDGTYTYNEKSFNLESFVVIIGKVFTLSNDYEEHFLKLNIEDDDINEAELIGLDHHEIPTFVMNFAKYISKNSINLKEKINLAFSSEFANKLDFSASRKGFAVLLASYYMLDEYVTETTGKSFLEVAEIQENPEEIIFSFIRENELFTSVDDLCERFREMLVTIAEDNSCILVDNTSGQYISNPSSNKNLPVLYIDKDHIYVSESDVKLMLESVDGSQKSFHFYADSLKVSGYIKVSYTKYSARPTISHPGRQKARQKMLAISRDFLSDIKFN